MSDTATLLSDEDAEIIAKRLGSSTNHLYFTNLDNKRKVAKIAKQLGVKTVSRTAHGSLLDPRYTVEGEHIPDKGLGNDYKHYHPKLYCLETAERNY